MTHIVSRHIVSIIENELDADGPAQMVHFFSHDTLPGRCGVKAFRINPFTAEVRFAVGENESVAITTEDPRRLADYLETLARYMREVPIDEHGLVDI